MTSIAVIFGFIAFALAITVGVLLRSRAALECTVRDQDTQLRDARSASELATTRLADLEQNDSRLRDMVDSLAAKALHANSAEFLKLARESFAAAQEKATGELEQRKQAVDTLIKPINEKLEQTQQTLEKLEAERIKAYGALKQQAADAIAVSGELRDETSKLVKALRKPEVRGRYGEIQLQRVVELAGLRQYCDFTTQASLRSAAGDLLRPDLVVHLPNDRLIAIDAKTNIDAYLDAIESDDPAQTEAHLDRFAKHVLDQAKALSKKEYASSLPRSPDFVVMFIPGDQFIDAALAHQPKLLEFAAEAGVILASPSTLIGLLRAVHVGWREQRLSESAQEIFELGRELHERASIAIQNAAKVGEAIDTAKKRYNTFVGSVDGRLMPTLRKFEAKGAHSAKAITNLIPIDGDVRSLQSTPTEIDKPVAMIPEPTPEQTLDHS